MYPLRQAIWRDIWQHTVEKNQTNATNVNMHPHMQEIGVPDCCSTTLPGSLMSLSYYQWPLDWGNCWSSKNPLEEKALILLEFVTEYWKSWHLIDLRIKIAAVCFLFLGNTVSQGVIIHLPLAHFPPTFLTHLPPVNEPFTPYVWHFYPLRFDTLPPFFRFFQGSYFVSLSWAVAE